jgi:putative transposase
MQEFRRERHSTSRLIVHLVCVTKYRRKVLDVAAIVWMQTHCANVCERMGAQLLALDGEPDHIHLLVEYPPKLAVSALVNALKGTSSRVLRRLRPDLARRYWKGVLWSPSYFAASTGGATLEKVEQYIQAQRASTAP